MGTTVHRLRSHAPHANSFARSVVWLSLAVALSGCAHYKEISGPVVLTDVATIIVPRTPLYARGIMIDLCLTPDSGYRSQQANRSASKARRRLGTLLGTLRM